MWVQPGDKLISFEGVLALKRAGFPGPILHGGNTRQLSPCPLVAWCPSNAPVEIYYFLIGCPLPRRNCLGANALSKMKHTGLGLVSPFQTVYTLLISIHGGNKDPHVRILYLPFVKSLRLTFSHVNFLLVRYDFDGIVPYKF